MAKKEEVKMEETQVPEQPLTQPQFSMEELTGQLSYAQKLIAILQNKLNDANGVNIQLEAKLQMANEK